MLIALKQNGVAEIVAPSRLFRGSEAEEYIVLSPYPNTVPLQIAFISPTGENSGYLPMTSVELPEQYQNLGLSAKSYVDTVATGTKEVGDAYICICAILPSENGGVKKTSYMCQYTVEETALPTLPDEPTKSQYDDILRYMANYETKINNAVKQSLNAEEAAESATEIAEEAKEQANAALINSARALLEANRKRLLDFTVNSNTGIGTKYFSDGTTATVQFPIGGGSAEEVAGTPLTSITFLASQFVDGELAISPMATGYTDNNFIVSVEEKALTNGYIQTANNVFKGTDGSILLSYNAPFDGRILLFGGGRLAANGSGSGGTYNYEDLENLPSINSAELLGNKTSAELGIYDMGVYPSTATLNKTEPSVSNTIAFGNIALLGKPLTALKHGDFIVDKYGTVAIIDTVDLENFTATYFTWTYHEVPQDVWEAIDLARTIAEGRSRAAVYNTLEGVVSVNGGTASSSGGKLAVGDNVYIRQLDVPDLWISSVKSTYASYTYVDDNQTVLDINNGIQFGYYVFGVLETNKVEIPRDYNDLENKPSINGVELSGNKTSADLKLGEVTANGGFKAGDYQLLDANGKIPSERLPEISGGGSNSSGIYYTSDTLPFNVSISNPYIELNGKTLQVGDMLINKSGVTAKITEILSVGAQPLKVGDTIVELYANPYITPDFQAFDWSGAEVYENAESIFYGMHYITLFNTTNGSKLVAGMLDYGGLTQYALIFMESNVTPSVSSIIYSILMGGFVDVYTINEVTISEVYQQDIWGQYIYKTNRRSNVGYKVISSPYQLLNKGQEVQGLVFNSKISVSKINEYLASLVFENNEYVLLSLRNGGGGSLRYEIKAINLTTLGQSLSVSTDGYAVGVYDVTLDRIVKLLYLSKYNQENVGIVEQLLATDYTPTITSAGWIDTSYLHAYCQIDPYTDIDFAVNAFIATDQRYWEVFEMFDNKGTGIVLDEYTATITTDTAENIERIYNIVNNAKSLGTIAINGEQTYHVNASSLSSSKLTSFVRLLFGEDNVKTQGYSCALGTGNRYLQMTMSATGNTVDSTNTDPFTVTITYFNDVEITA